ncbi:TetR family transcriptional regulator [soil metagenome]
MTFSNKTARPTKEETKNRILEKADELFRQYGFGKTTVADIAEEMEMSSANIYKFFASKEAIVQASADRNLAIVRKNVADIARSSASVGQRIEGIVLVIFRFHQDLFRNERQIFKMVIQAMEEAWTCVDDYYAFLSATFRALLEEGMKKGEVRPADLDELATALFDSLHVAMHPHLRPQWSPTENDHRVRAHIRLVIAALR